MEIFSILEKVSDPRRDHLKKYSLESIFYIHYCPKKFSHRVN